MEREKVMPTIFDSDEFNERRKMMLEMFDLHNIPHIKTEVLNDHVGEESPVMELAGLFEFLVNTLIGDVIMGASDSSATLLEHLKHELEAQIFLMGSLMEDSMEERKERLKKKEEKEEEEPQTEIPNVFKEALEQIQGKGKAE